MGYKATGVLSYTGVGRINGRLLTRGWVKPQGIVTPLEKGNIICGPEFARILAAAMMQRVPF